MEEERNTDLIKFHDGLVLHLFTFQTPILTAKKNKKV